MAPRALIVAPGLASTAPAPSGILTAAQRAGIPAELVEPASENELRRRLEAGGVELVYLLARGKAHAAAGHATLDFDGASGPASRPVNLRHLASVIAGAGARLVLLQPTEATAELGGSAAALVEHGLPAAILWPPLPSVPLLGEAARRLFERWREGAPLTELAAAAGTMQGVESAGTLAAATPTSPTPTDAPAPPAAARPAAPEPAVSAAELRRREIQAMLESKRAAGRFDVFLCHNWADKPAVKAIARSLQERGILPWLDEWELPPGQPWQALLERQIESIRSAAVCVGQAGVGPWQEQELYGFLREFVARKAPVIPVLLPDAPSAPELPVFLRAMTWVDFRQSEAEPLDRLEWGITGVRPAFE
jgi:TIR domain